MRHQKSLFNALLTHFLMGVALGLSLVLLLGLIEAFHVRDIVAKSDAPVQTALMLVTTYGLMFGIGATLTGLVLTLEDRAEARAAPDQRRRRAIVPAMICMATPTTHPAMIIQIHTRCGSWRSTITPTEANAENAARKVPTALSSSGVSILPIQLPSAGRPFDAARRARAAYRSRDRSRRRRRASSASRKA